MALGAGTFTAAGGAVSDLFASSGLKTRAAGNRLQAQQYGLAADLAAQNKQFAEASTAIKVAQQQRELGMALGETRADVAASGFESSGTALDLLRDSASQGALTKAALQQQGLMEEAGYEEQAKSYQIMQSSALMAAQADEKAAKGAVLSSIIKGASALATLIPGVGPAIGAIGNVAAGAIGGGAAGG